MDASRSLMISFSLYNYDGSPANGPYGGYPHPRDIPDPPHINERAWIPQTIGDAIWKIYEFDTAEHRDAFKDNPGDIYAAAHIETPLQAFYDHWIDSKLSDPSEWFEDAIEAQ